MSLTLSNVKGREEKVLSLQASTRYPLQASSQRPFRTTPHVTAQNVARVINSPSGRPVPPPNIKKCCHLPPTAPNPILLRIFRPNAGKGSFVATGDLRTGFGQTKPPPYSSQLQLVDLGTIHQSASGARQRAGPSLQLLRPWMQTNLFLKEVWSGPSLPGMNPKSVPTWRRIA